jgi:hypothetical protein
VKAKRKLTAVSPELIFTVVLRTPQDEVAFAQARAQKNYARHEVATRAHNSLNVRLGRIRKKKKYVRLGQSQIRRHCADLATNRYGYPSSYTINQKNHRGFAPSFTMDNLASRGNGDRTHCFSFSPFVADVHLHHDD